MKTRCWQFEEHGEPHEALQWREQELPEPGPGQALVALRAIGLNRSELRYVAGSYVPPRSLPSCVGHEGVGEILALGPPNPEAPASPHTPLEVGARVALMPGRVDMVSQGSYRQHGVYDQQALLPVPAALTDEEAAGFWMGVLTMGGAFLTAGFDPAQAAGKRVLITAAASGMGVMGLRMARAWGAETLAVTRSPHKQERLGRLADHVLVCTEPNRLASLVHTATRGEGFDVALDPVGAEYVPGLLQAAAPLASMVIYEMISGREAQLALPMMLVKDLGLHGFTLFRLFRTPGMLDRVIELGLSLGEDGVPVVSEVFPLEDAPGALSVMSHGQHLGKLVLTNSCSASL